MTGITPVPLVGVLLAGGRARRMGGGEKCLLPLGGRPLLAHAADRLAKQVDTIVLNANADESRFADFGLPVVADTYPGNQGPLAGILAGIEWARSHRPDIGAIVTVATDTPFYPDDLARRLMAASQAERIAVARSGDRLHRVFGVFPVSCGHALQHFLSTTKNRKVGDWLDEAGFAVVDFDHRSDGFDPFFNVNTPTDLHSAEAMVRTRE